MAERQQAERKMEVSDGLTARGERPPPEYVELLQEARSVEAVRQLPDCHGNGCPPDKAREHAGIGRGT